MNGVNKTFSFSKDNYTSDKEIEELYNRKIESTSSVDIQNKLFRARMYDPRKSDVYFGSEKVALKAQEIGKRLQKLSLEEFIASDYPFMWLDELAGEAIFKVVNKKILKPIS